MSDPPTSEVDLKADVLTARMVVGMTSLLMFMLVLMGSLYYKVWKAPSFVWVQCLTIGLCNLGGLIISSSLITSQFYESGWTFAWQSFWLSMYFGANILGGWFFSYRYLLTARSLSMEVRRRKDAIEMTKVVGKAIEIDNSRYKDQCCANGNCCNQCGLKCMNGCTMCCLFCTILVWFIISAGNWNCTENWETTFGTQPPDTDECNIVEDWVGSLYSYTTLNFFGIVCRLLVVFVFMFALCKINCLVGELKKYNFIKSRKVLYIHIGASIIDIIFSLSIGMWSFIESADLQEKS